MVQCEISVRWQLDENACRSLVAILPNPEHASLRRDQVWQSRASRLPAVWNALSLAPIVASAPSLARLEQLASNRSIGQLDFHFRALPALPSSQIARFQTPVSCDSLWLSALGGFWLWEIILGPS
jgi:hypothetical protein